MKLIKTLRWFGENDPVTLREISQTGATGVVTALHHIKNGKVWSIENILKRKHEIETHGLTWEVVESLPIHEDIKKGNLEREKLIANYKQSIKNLRSCGLKTICYNFIPLLDWARTNLEYTLENGVEAMYFDKIFFTAFDLFILKRPNANKESSKLEIDKAKLTYNKLSKVEKDRLGYTIIVKTQSFIDGAVKEEEKNYINIFNNLLAEYHHIDKDKLRENYSYFLNEVIETAELSGVNLAVHPDAPPFPLLGLPRIVSTAEDFEWLSKTYPSLNNGITFCTGSLGARLDNNLLKIFEKFSNRIHFLYLRSTQVLDNGNFFETHHLSNISANLIELVLEELFRRKKSGRFDYNLPMRPDHGHKILDDFKRQSNPRYPLIGRLKGLAEITGLEYGLLYKMYKV